MSDESLNSFGFRVLTDGIDLTDFERNPVMLFGHFRSVAADFKDPLLPIGRWENIRKEGGKLIGDAVFDEDDEFAMKVWGKVEKGILNACSIGFEDLQLSELPEHLLPGQVRPTVVRSMLKECSIADIPSNSNAIKIMSPTKTVTLSSAGGDELDQLIPQLSTKSHIDMKLVLSTLSLSDTASEQDAVVAIGKLAAKLRVAEEKASQFQTLADEKLALEQKVFAMEKAANEAKITALVSDAIKDRKYVEADRAMLIKLASSDFAFAAEMISAKKPVAAVHNQLGAGAESEDETRDWTFEDYSVKAPDKLMKLKAENWDAYSALFRKQYGVEPKKA